MFVPLSSTKTSCSGSSWATAARQAVRASSSRSLAASVFFYASSPGGGSPATSSPRSAAGPWCSAHQAQCSSTVASGAASSRARKIASCSGPNAARAAGNGLALQRARLARLHHGAFDRSHGDAKAASGFSHGLTVSHRSHQAFFQVGRIGTHTVLYAQPMPAFASRKLL